MDWLAMGMAGIRAVQGAALQALAPRAIDLEGRVVVVVGGTRGLGLLLARAFGRQGARLAICGRDGKTLDQALYDLEPLGVDVLGLRCDISDRRQAEAMIAQVLAHYGRIDVLVNNAAIMEIGPVDDMAFEDFEDVMATNFWGAVAATMAAVPAMKAAGFGRVVNIASIGGRTAVPHMLPYDCAKFALRGFSEGMAAELAKDGIVVTTVMPGLMRTGGPVNALYKGHQAEEFNWMSLMQATPALSMDAERAAERIVEATRRGELEITLSWQAQVLGLLHDLAPAAVIGAMGVANRFLPPPTGEPTALAPGRRFVTMATYLGPQRPTIDAAKDLNQYVRDDVPT
jgi:NAD(P)-dependent dehydrogenase (short-subunit alcohol dehydrogenase family)